MRYLILSDLHGNWEALQAVLADAKDSWDTAITCGDLVGYGPDPNQVVDWARERVSVAIRGNHDRACCGGDLEWFNPVAAAAARWTMRHLTSKNRDYLEALPQGPVRVEDFLLVHGSPLDEDEYVITPDDAENMFPYLEAGITFFGHTHLQGGFRWYDGEQYLVDPPILPDASAEFTLDPDHFWLINPGSVGQPRDDDPRAAYALYDADRRRLLLRRAVYDTAAVRRRIREAGLPPALGARLAVGQ